MSINISLFPSQIWNGIAGTARSRRDDNKTPDYEDFDQIAAEIIALETAVIDLIQGGSGAASVPRLFGTTAGAVAVGNVLYNNAGVLTLADVASEAQATVYGLAADAVGAAGEIEVLSEGGKLSLLDWTGITGSALLTPDAYYYVDASGGLTETPTVVNFEWVAQVGLALDENTLLIEIGTPNENTPE